MKKKLPKYAKGGFVKKYNRGGTTNNPSGYEMETYKDRIEDPYWTDLNYGVVPRGASPMNPVWGGGRPGRSIWDIGSGEYINDHTRRSTPFMDLYPETQRPPNQPTNISRGSNPQIPNSASTSWTPDGSLAKQNLLNIPSAGNPLPNHGEGQGITDNTPFTQDPEFSGGKSTMPNLQWTPQDAYTPSNAEEDRLRWTKGMKAGTAIAGAGALTQLGLALKPADVEKFRANPYAGKIRENLESMGYDERPLHLEVDREANKAKYAIDSSTTSQAVRRSNLLGLSSNVSAQKTQIGQHGQDVRNQIRAQRAQAYLGLGERDRSTQLQVDDWNARNRGQRRSNISDAVQGISQFGTQTANLDTSMAQNRLTLESVNALATNYGISTDRVNEILSGSRKPTYKEMIFLKKIGAV